MLFPPLSCPVFPQLSCWFSRSDSIKATNRRILQRSCIDKSEETSAVTCNEEVKETTVSSTNAAALWSIYAGPMAPSALSGPYVALVLLFFGLTYATPSGPASPTCATLEQSRFFGVFSSTTTLPATPCSWTLQNPDPRRYTVYMKITKPTDTCVPRQIRTFQFDSFIETSRTYLGMESFDEVVRLCDASTTVTYLESTKQFLQIRKVASRNGLRTAEDENDVGEFKAEFLVVGKRNPSMPACQMLCQWLEKCLSGSTHDYPCGIMNTPCQCWEAPKRKPGSCYRGGVYVEKCNPVPKDNGRDAEIISK